MRNDCIAFCTLGSMRIDCMACYTLPMRPSKMLLFLQVKVFQQRQRVALIPKCTSRNLSLVPCTALYHQAALSNHTEADMKA